MHHSFLIHSFTDGYIGCFQHLAIVDNAALNIVLHGFFAIGDSGFLGYSPSSGIASPKVSSISSVLRKLHSAFHRGCASLHSHQQCSRAPFSHQPHQHLVFVDLIMMAISWYIFWGTHSLFSLTQDLGWLWLSRFSFTTDTLFFVVFVVILFES